MRLTDKRFLSEGFYEPKSKEERLEIQFMDKPSYWDVYRRLGEYENTNLQPSDIEEMNFSHLISLLPELFLVRKS